MERKSTKQPAGKNQCIIETTTRLRCSNGKDMSTFHQKASVDVKFILVEKDLLDEEKL